VRRFTAPKKSLGDLDAEAAATLIATAADVALILDPEGIVRDVAFGAEDAPFEGAGDWLGLAWADTVAPESRPKVEQLLRDGLAGAPPKWRQVNYHTDAGAEVPVLYSLVRVGERGHLVAVGRDLRTVAQVQQRLIDAQQSMERDYARLRQLETRYRLLFKLSSEAVLIVEVTSGKIVEANPAAAALFGGNARALVGRLFPLGMDEEGAEVVRDLMAQVRQAGRGDPVAVRLAEGRAANDDAGAHRLEVSASMFRQERSSYFLIRLTRIHPEPAADGGRREGALLDVMADAPDGFVVTDPGGTILTANTAFLDMAQLATEAQARGESLGRYVGRPGVDLNGLLTTLRNAGSVRMFTTSLQGEYGSSADVEISAVAVPEGDPPCLGFVIRDVTQRLAAAPAGGPGLPGSVEQLTELVGRVPLREIIRETTDVIERLCIQAALELTSDNRASAAEMLGLSRQSLYVKLHRYGLGDRAAEEGP